MNNLVENLIDIEKTITEDHTKILNFLSSKGVNVDNSKILRGDEPPASKAVLLKKINNPMITTILRKETFISGIIWGISKSFDFNRDTDTYDLSKDAIPSKLPGFIKRVKDTKIVTVVEGKYLSFKIIGLIGNDKPKYSHGFSDPYSYYGFFSINLPETAPGISTIFKSLKLKNKVARNWVLHNLITYMWEETPIPPMFYEGLPKTFFEEGLYTISSSSPIYIPDKSFYKKNTNTFLKILQGEKVSLESNTIIFIDSNKNVLATDSNRNIVSFTLEGIKPASNSDRKLWISKTTNILSSKSRLGLASSIPWLEDYKVYPLILNFFRTDQVDTIVKRADAVAIEAVIEEDWFHRFLNKLEEFGNTKYSHNSVINWMTFMGKVKILKSCIGKVNTIKDTPTRIKEDIVKQVTERVNPTKKVNESADNKPYVELYMGSYNDIPVLIAYPEEEEYEDILEKANFRYLGEFWIYEVPSRARGGALLDILDNKYNIPPKNYKECEKILNEMKRSKYPYEFPENGVRNFLRLNKKKVPAGTLRIYPLIIDEEVHFVVDKDTHPSISLSKYKFEVTGGCFIYIAVNVSDLKKAWARINKLTHVTNRKEAIKLAKSAFQIALP